MPERFVFSDLREIFAKANEEKSGAQLAGLEARSERERVAAKRKLVSVPAEFNGGGHGCTSTFLPFPLFESPDQSRKVHFYVMDCVSKFVEISLH
jgi:hypothetical protein